MSDGIKFRIKSSVTNYVVLNLKKEENTIITTLKLSGELGSLKYPMQWNTYASKEYN